MDRKIKVTLIVFSLIMMNAILSAQDGSSFGLAPYKIGDEKGQPQYQGEPTDANTGFGIDALASPVPFLSMPIPAGTPFTTVNANFTPGWLAGADMNDVGAFYGCTYIGLGQSNLVQVNTSTGAPTVIGPITGISQYPTSMAYNSVNSTWYYGETNGTTSRLYTLNVSTGAATFVGQITNVAGLIALAIDCSGQAFAVDMVSDNLYSVNLTTGAGTMIGSMGFNANYAQDCDFDAATGTLYLASYDLSAGASLRTCNTSTGGTTIIVTWPGSEITGFAIDNLCGPPCPVGPPTNPSPANGATNQPILGLSLGWTNGTGTTMNEVWFGPAGNVVKVYDGAAKTTHALGTLDYNKLYQWYIVCKDATCGTTGPGWSFTTMQDPNIITPFWEPFNNFNCWTPIGPLGTTNWSLSSTNFAGGTAPPELRLSWTPSFNGLSKLLSCNITTNSPYAIHYLELDHFCDWYADPAPFMGVGITYDDGVTYSTIWEFQPVGGNVGPDRITATFTLTSAYFKLVIYCNGNSFNIDFWYVDDILIYQGSPVLPYPPSNLTAQVIFNPDPQVQLNWQDNSFNEVGFRVFRKNGNPNDPGDYILIGTVGQNITQYIDVTVLPESTYTYRVFAYNEYGQTGSNTATITVPIPVNIDETGNEELPDEFSLYQNYPNPFNPSTKIKYAIPSTPLSFGEGLGVRLVVYDILGNEVATLVNEEQAPGVYEVEFNIYSDEGQNLSSGIYFYQLLVSALQSKDGKAGSYMETKKMVLLK
jgi:hypothetical protein